jgi:hypothetical protein
MSEPTFYIVKPEQVGREDLGDFLRKAIALQFEGKEYYVSKEEIVEKITPYSQTPRKLRGFLINEANKIGHAIYFDVTDCTPAASFFGR